jgi:hypothetical protein
LDTWDALKNKPWPLNYEYLLQWDFDWEHRTKYDGREKRGVYLILNSINCYTIFGNKFHKNVPKDKKDANLRIFLLMA